MERSSPQAIYSLLQQWGIPYDSMEHPEAGTMEDCKAIGRQLGAPFCKNLFWPTGSKRNFSCCSSAKTRSSARQRSPKRSAAPA